MIRWWIIGLLALFICALCYYSYRYHPGVDLDDCLNRPDFYDGAIVYTPHEAKIRRITDDGFILSWGGKEIQVKAVHQALSVGSYVQVKGIFHKERYIKALAVRIGYYRKLKMAASLVGALIVAYLLSKRFKWDRGAHAFTEV